MFKKHEISYVTTAKRHKDGMNKEAARNKVANELYTFVFELFRMVTTEIRRNRYITVVVGATENARPGK